MYAILKPAALFRAVSGRAGLVVALAVATAILAGFGAAGYLAAAATDEPIGAPPLSDPSSPAPRPLPPSGPPDPATAPDAPRRGLSVTGARPASEDSPGGPRLPDDAGRAASGPLTVEVGLYIIDLARLDMKDSEFFADFYVWYKFRPDGVTSWTPQNIEFMNGTVDWSSPPASDTTADGKTYWSHRVKGTFRGRFALQRYPFDSQTLPIVIEDTSYDAERVVFAPDPNARGTYRGWLEKSVQIPDWKIENVRANIDVHRYATDFGTATVASAPGIATDYSRFTFTVQIDRLFIPHFVKFIIPLVVIAGMAYVVFFINAREFEAQCGICVTALLSAVALHISQADSLPAVGYLVMADKIFILFYIVIFSALAQTVTVNNYAKRGRFWIAERMDELFQIIYPLILIAGVILIWLVT